MNATWERICLALLDPLFGRILSLSADLAILAVSAATSLLVVLARRALCNQDFLRRVAEDRTRLKELIKADRKSGDVEALRRRRALLSRVAMSALGQEWKPLLAVLLPVAIVATWCLARLGFHPPRDGEELVFAARMPVSCAGRVVHMVPAGGLECDGWIKPVEVVTNRAAAFCEARWRIRARAAGGDRIISVRCGRRTLEHPLSVGRDRYAPDRLDHGGGFATRVFMREIRLFGLLPGLARPIALPPWLIAYLVLVLPLTFVLKKALRVR